jgi:two-component system OmpR family response regulator
MYSSETHRSGIFNTVDAGTTGRILVIDDDRSFGGFMLAALESRGHDVDWAGCMADGLASLYSHRYDLVIVDLRLPDGSGLEFLRNAMDEGVLVDSAAIVLTGQDDFEEPDDIRVYRKPVELEPFLDRMANIVAHTQKRRGAAGRYSPAARSREPGRDGHRSPKREKIDLVLYTSRASEKCQKAVRTIRAVLDQYDNAEVSFSIFDLSDGPPPADEDAVVFTPTLVKRAPGPKTWIIGNLNQPDLLIDLLEVSGVSRRKD